MKRIILFWVALSWSTFSVHSQSIKGKVVNEVGDALPSVTIKVLEMDTVPTKYFITDLKGEFYERIPYKKYTLIFSFLGYESLFIKVPNQDKVTIDLGKVVLFVKDNVLDEVQVTGSNLVEKADRIIAFPSVLQVKHTSNSLELLKVMNLPGLSIDNISEKVTISGTSSVKYKINHVPATYDQVAVLRSSEILRVEYHQTPSARELDSDSGIINFILKENRIGTLASTDVLSALSTGFVNGKFNGKTIGDKSVFSVGYKINYRDYDKNSIDVESHYMFPSGRIDESSIGKTAFDYKNQSINLGYTYRNGKNTFDIQFSHDFFRSNAVGNSNIISNISFVERQRSDRSDKDMNTLMLNAYYIRMIDKGRILESNIIGKLVYNDSDTKLVDTRNDTISDMVIRASSESRKVILGELYYNDSRNKYYNFQFGMRVNMSYTTNKFNKERTFFDKYEIFPYAGLQWKRGKFSYQLSTALLVYYLKKDEESKSNNVNNVSSIQLFYNTERCILRNVISYRTSSPALSQLTDNYQKQDPVLVWKGNPNLDSYQTFMNQTILTLNFTKKIRWESVALYRKIFSPIVNYYHYDRGLDMILSQPLNAKYNQELQGISVFYLNSLFDIISLNFAIEYNNYKTKGKNYKHLYNSFSWSTEISVLYKGFGLFAEYTKPKSMLSGEFIQQRENNSSVSFRYIKKPLSIDIGVDFFLQDGARYRNQSLNFVYNYDRRSLIKDNANMFFIKLSYSFSSGKSAFRVRKAISIDDNETSINE